MAYLNTLLARQYRSTIHRPIAVCIAIVCLFTTSCTTVGTVKNRAEESNLTTGSYANAAILFNILRSKEAEPLSFVSFTALTGHTTASTSLGLPTLVVGPDRTAAQKLFSFGPGSVSGSEATDFNLSVVDDPQSFAALSRPITPATLGFLVNRMYSREFLFFLSVSKIVVETKTASGTHYETYLNEPLVGTDGDKAVVYDHWLLFYFVMEKLLSDGLTTFVDQTYVPAPGSAGNAQFCFDEDLPDNPDLNDAVLRDEWTKVDKPDASDNNAGHFRSSQSGFPNWIVPTDSQCYPLKKNDEQQTLEDKAAGQAKSAAIAQNNKPAEVQAPVNSWTVSPSKNVTIRFYTRSVLGIYRYLGLLANMEQSGGWNDLLKRDIHEQPLANTFHGNPKYQILHLTNDLSGCWTSVSFEGKPWCVPSDAVYTKKTFLLLHELFEFYAAPANQPTTSTVRTTQ